MPVSAPPRPNAIASTLENTSPTREDLKAHGPSILSAVAGRYPEVDVALQEHRPRRSAKKDIGQERIHPKKRTARVQEAKKRPSEEDLKELYRMKRFQGQLDYFQARLEMLDKTDLSSIVDLPSGAKGDDLENRGQSFVDVRFVQRAIRKAQEAFKGYVTPPLCLSNC
ncbi:hypothetical protein LXA43DRAFT_1089955 [Ganoderma leucocontextum]|nr:hypothetical protein LXA43DRAFT_1089955 [Ganoderma leucocontextum]